MPITPLPEPIPEPMPAAIDFVYQLVLLEKEDVDDYLRKSLKFGGEHIIVLGFKLTEIF